MYQSLGMISPKFQQLLLSLVEVTSCQVSSAGAYLVAAVQPIYYLMPDACCATSFCFAFVVTSIANNVLSNQLQHSLASMTEFC